MKKFVYLVCVLSVLGLAVSQQALCNSRTEDPIGVAVSPQLLILSTTQGGSVTVHTSVAYSSVARDTVQLNGIDASSTYSDSCGNLVAKFSETEVEAIVEGPSAVLTLTGEYLDGTAFSGSDTVRVK